MFDFHKSLNDDSIVKITSWIILPLIILFGVYLQIQGEVSPGGGFQAGIVLSVAYSLFLLVFGPTKTSKLLSFNSLVYMATAGVMLYVLLGFITMLLGGFFLDLKMLTFSVHPQAIGLFIIELGVAFCVFGSMSTIIYSFYLLVGRSVEDDRK